MSNPYYPAGITERDVDMIGEPYSAEWLKTEDGCMVEFDDDKCEHGFETLEVVRAREEAEGEHDI